MSETVEGAGVNPDLVSPKSQDVVVSEKTIGVRPRPTPQKLIDSYMKPSTLGEANVNAGAVDPQFEKFGGGEGETQAKADQVFDQISSDQLEPDPGGGPPPAEASGEHQESPPAQSGFDLSSIEDPLDRYRKPAEGGNPIENALLRQLRSEDPAQQKEAAAALQEFYRQKASAAVPEQPAKPAQPVDEKPQNQIDPVTKAKWEAFAPMAQQVLNHRDLAVLGGSVKEALIKAFTGQYQLPEPNEHAGEAERYQHGIQMMQLQNKLDRLRDRAETEVKLQMLQQQKEAAPKESSLDEMDQDSYERRKRHDIGVGIMDVMQTYSAPELKDPDIARMVYIEAERLGNDPSTPPEATWAEVTKSAAFSVIRRHPEWFRSLKNNSGNNLDKPAQGVQPPNGARDVRSTPATINPGGAAQGLPKPDRLVPGLKAGTPEHNKKIAEVGVNLLKHLRKV